MNIKKGVRLDKLQPQMLLACMIVQEVWAKHGCDPTITSGNDPAEGRKDNSLHPAGFALDFRTRNLEPTMASFLAERVEKKLNEEYDVVLGLDTVRKVGHLHIEYDPKVVPAPKPRAKRAPKKG